MGWLRGNTQVPVNQSGPTGKEVKVTGKKAEESALQYIQEAVARGQWFLFASTSMCLTWWMEVVLLGGECPYGLICSVCPLSSHGSLSVAGALMAFMCLTCAHTILVGVVLSWKKDKGETLTHSSGSYSGCSEQWGIWNTPEGYSGQSSSIASTTVAYWQRVPMRKQKRGDGEETPSP